VRSVAAACSRLRIGIGDDSAFQAANVCQRGVRGAVLATPDCVHVIVGPEAQAAAQALLRLLGPGES